MGVVAPGEKKVLNSGVFGARLVYVQGGPKVGIQYIVYRLGFTLSQATKALRESRGIALLYFRPLH